MFRTVRAVMSVLLAMVTAIAWLVVTDGAAVAATRCTVTVRQTPQLITVDRSGNCGNYVWLGIKVDNISVANRGIGASTMTQHAALERWNGVSSDGAWGVVVSAAMAPPHPCTSSPRSLLCYPDSRVVANHSGVYGGTGSRVLDTLDYVPPPPDRVPPTLRGVSLKPTVNHAFTASARATDNVWVARYQWVWNRSATQVSGAVRTTSGPSATGPRLAVGTWYLHVRAVDADGNGSAWKAARATVVADRTAPVVSALAVSARGTRVYTATSTARDNHAVVQYRWIWNTSPTGVGGTQRITSTGALGEVALGPGTWYLHVCALDAAGNRSPWRSSAGYLVPEATPPVVTSVSATMNADSSSTGTATASDNVGVVRYDWVWNLSPTAVDGTIRSTVTGVLPSVQLTASTGKWYLHVRAADAAGNLSGWKASEGYDVWGPPTIGNADLSSSSSGCNVVANARSEFAEPTQFEWRLDGSTATGTEVVQRVQQARYSYVVGLPYPYVSSLDVTPLTAGTWVAHVRVSDWKGNVSAWQQAAGTCTV